MLVFGPVGVPSVIVGVGNENGAAGINQVTIVFGVNEVPIASTVGLLQVKVWVNIVADTFGNTVFDNNTTGNGVWQPLTGSNTTKVQVPGTPVVVQFEAPKATPGKGTVAVLVGGIKAY